VPSYFCVCFWKGRTHQKTEDKTQSIIRFWRSFFFLQFVWVFMYRQHCAVCGLSTNDCTHIADHSCTSHVHAHTIWNNMKQYETIAKNDFRKQVLQLLHLYAFVHIRVSVLVFAGCPLLCHAATEFLEDAPQESLKVRQRSFSAVKTVKVNRIRWCKNCWFITGTIPFSGFPPS